MVIACPFCREASPDMLDEWRGQGFCSTCGRSWKADTQPQAAAQEKKPEDKREVA